MPDRIVHPNRQISETSERRLSLSSKGLQRLESVSHENDFAFILGDERYCCPSFVAEFLSPRLSSLRAQDATIQEFCLEIDDPHHSFSDFVTLGFGHEIVLGVDNVSFIRSVCKELQNYELFEMTLELTDGKVSREQFVARVEFMSGVESNGHSDMGIMASHFYECSVSDFDNLSFSVLHAIVSDPGLVLQTEDSLLEVIVRHGAQDPAFIGLLEWVRFEFLSDQGIRSAFDFISASFDFLTVAIWEGIGKRLTLPVTPPPKGQRFALPSIESGILSEPPMIFSQFYGSELQLLYRGTRDGFKSADFHRCCNGHSPTLTVVLDTDGYIFGGYTPLRWSSRGTWMTDPGLKSFIFTIKNPRHSEPRIFTQHQEANEVWDHPSCGPTFGGNHDLCICNDCNTQKTSYSNLGGTYTNDTGLAGSAVLTGSRNFLVREIEVFEVKQTA
jgi:hypothetical protein